MSLTIDINYLDAFNESDHPRGSGSKGGQFVKKGTEGFKAPEAKTVYHVKPIKAIQAAAAGGGTAAEIVAKINAVTAGYKHANVASYANNTIKLLEKHIGVPAGSLGKALTKAKADLIVAKTNAIIAAKSTPQPQKHAGVQKIDDILNNMNDPIEAAKQIKAMKTAYFDVPQVVINHANEMLEGILKYNPDQAEELHAIINGTALSKKYKPWQIGGKTTQPHGDIYNVYQSSAPPIVQAARIKAIARMADNPETTKYANEKLQQLEQQHDVPPGTYAHTAGSVQATVKPAALPKPHPDSEPQKKLYEIANQPLTDKEKIFDLTTAMESMYRGGYAQTYGQQLIAALGGEGLPETTASKQAKAAPPPPKQPGLVTPSKPGQSWVKAKATFDQSFKPMKSYWSDDEAMESFNSATTQAWEGFNAASTAALSYSGSGSEDINAALRDPSHASSDVVDQIDAIDDAFTAPMAKMKRDTIVMRGTNLSKAFVDKLKEGLNKNLPTRFPLDGFTSASFKDKPAFYNKPYWLHICVRKDTPCLAIAASPNVGKGEAEVILRHGQSYELLSMHEEGGKTHLHVVTVV